MPWCSRNLSPRHRYATVWFLASSLFATGNAAFSLSMSSTLPSVAPATRRTALTHFVEPVALIFGFLPVPQEAVAAPFLPDPQAISTVILDSPDTKLGIQLADAAIQVDAITHLQTFPVVRSVVAGGSAATGGVKPGMIVLGNFPDGSESVRRRLERGPYPVVLQFYNLALDGEDPQQALAVAQDAGKAAIKIQEPPLSSKGTGLVVKTIQNPSQPCRDPAKRGDMLEIQFEARVASPGGPLYDSTAEREHTVRFTIGAGEVVPGVDIGVNGMCPGEIRTLDIPSPLGYGRLGSDVFDIPGDVRLWWKIELVALTKKSR